MTQQSQSTTSTSTSPSTSMSTSLSTSTSTQDAEEPASSMAPTVGRSSPVVPLRPLVEPLLSPNLVRSASAVCGRGRSSTG